MQATPEVAPPPVQVTIRREDYTPPAWLVPEIALDFALGIDATTVEAKLKVSRNPAGSGDQTLRLKGDGIAARNVRVDGAQTNAWRMDGDDLLIDLPGDSHEVALETALNPSGNSQLMGLYASNGMLCTQCEAEGFRRITFFPDRPDVLSIYTVRMEGDKAQFPVLLANGNCTASGAGESGTHWAEWHDPWPKPSYLFALVAGDLVANSSSFTTMSGRKVALNIWVREGDQDRTHHAMQALKDSMKWDEDTFGREYDLDLFNIVAVSDFNMGAMENKGLNVFNTRYILADPETATDADYDGIQGVVAHEYFHNWSGNRVTCRDWFQLSLKEGFTVLRDQLFSQDMGSPSVKRIEDVRMLRGAQFPEDSGPLAHPIRPDAYQEISNFYTATVYNKGAEVIRMMRTMAGAERFRAGTDLYFERHDGEAATCEDFVRAIEDGAGLELKQFRRWYEQAGTPKVEARLSHSGDTAKLTLKQTVPPTPGQPEKQPMVIPLRLALFDRATGSHRDEELVVLNEAQAEFSFAGFAEKPVLSLNRGFSAPVSLDAGQSDADLLFLAAHDGDPFARYEAMQQLMLNCLIADVMTGEADHAAVVAAVKATLEDRALEPAFKAEAILLPSESLIGDQMPVAFPDKVFKARKALQKSILKGVRRSVFRDIWLSHSDAEYARDPELKGRRRLKNVALGYLMAEHTEYSISYTWTQYQKSNNMTDRLAALGLLAHSRFGARSHALEDFHDRFKSDPLVIDKWFSVQAMSSRADTIDMVQDLSRHPDFKLSNPNRVRALYMAFVGNQMAFHAASGAGYRMIADLILTLDPLNAQTAARFVAPLGRWRRIEPGRAALMQAELERLVAAPKLSKDTFEQVSKSLG